MFVYAGIDEAGYGPMLGPLLVGRTVMGIEGHEPGSEEPPRLWHKLSGVVSKTPDRKRGRIAVNDSKKLHHPGTEEPLRHLERGVLSFAHVAGHPATSLDALLDFLGEQSHHTLDGLPWYAATSDSPWDNLPRAITPGELAVSRSMLASACQRLGVRVLDMGAHVVFEDRFNELVAAMRSKAATSFTFVAQHLRRVWDHHGTLRPYVAVDHQSGRTHYRELLALAFPEAHLRILDERSELSAYHLRDDAGRAMTVRFEVEAEQRHLPVALASMVSKYTREVLMARFQRWFAQRAPHIKPTAGYAQDAKRFLTEIEPLLPALSVQASHLVRSL